VRAGDDVRDDLHGVLPLLKAELRSRDHLGYGPS
jgi:hypothetical protein